YVKVKVDPHFFRESTIKMKAPETKIGLTSEQGPPLQVSTGLEENGSPFLAFLMKPLCRRDILRSVTFKKVKLMIVRLWSGNK
ncbi:hypothetical protein AVEN_158254-1, partial [Araneus ventricosus]